jgi:hypothetical protein
MAKNVRRPNAARVVHARHSLHSGAPVLASAALVLAALGTGSCGGQGTPLPAAPAAANPAPETAAAAPASPAPASSPPPAAPPKGAASPDGVVYDEVEDPTNLKPLFEKTAMPSFPPGTVNEQACWQTMSLSGSAKKDYEALIAKCGASTGAVEYVKPTLGKLHEKHDKRDTFVVPIQGGLCYRFFGVADATIKDLDVLIEKKGGALVGDDKTTGPVAIIESDKAWCIDKDGVYSFLVEVDGHGSGDYVFGIWARKNK